jgi:hypothetical protein
MGRKAGIFVVTAGVAATAAIVATTVFGLGASPMTVKRPDALRLRARIEGPSGAPAAKAANQPRPRILYGATKPQFLPMGEQEIAVSGCPRRYHVTNGTAAAVHPGDAPNFTIRGSGPLATRKGAVKGWFIDLSNSSATPIAAVGFIVCQRPTR